MISTDEQDAIESESEIGKVGHETQPNDQDLFDNDSQKLNKHTLAYVEADKVCDHAAIAYPREHLNGEDGNIDCGDEAEIVELSEALENVRVFLTSNDVDDKRVGYQTKERQNIGQYVYNEYQIEAEMFNVVHKNFSK